MIALYLILAGLLDRVRGGWPHGRPGWAGHLAKALAGACMVAVVTIEWPLLLAGAVLIGQLSWRQDNGWRGDWVRGKGRTTLALRWGIIWALPLVLISWWEPRLLAYLVTAPLGAWLAMWLSCRLPSTEVLDLRHAWPWSELIELPIIGALTWVVVG